MQTILLTSGAAALAEQGAAKLRIVRFDVGNRAASVADVTQWDAAEPPLTTMQGTVVHSGGVSAMQWAQTGADEIRIACVVDEAVPDITVGNVVLWVQLNNAAPVPFSYSATATAWVKLGTSGRSAGARFPFYLVLRFPQVLSRFDLSALRLAEVTWPRVDDEWDLPIPYTDPHDQFVLREHRRWGGVVPVLKVHNRWFGLQHATPVTPGAFPRPRLSGGVSGDNYRKD